MPDPTPIPDDLDPRCESARRLLALAQQMEDLNCKTAPFLDPDGFNGRALRAALYRVGAAICDELSDISVNLYARSN